LSYARIWRQGAPCPSMF